MSKKGLDMKEIKRMIKQMISRGIKQYLDGRLVNRWSDMREIIYDGEKWTWKTEIVNVNDREVQLLVSINNDFPSLAPSEIREYIIDVLIRDERFTVGNSVIDRFLLTYNYLPFFKDPKLEDFIQTDDELIDFFAFMMMLNFIDPMRQKLNELVKKKRFFAYGDIIRGILPFIECLGKVLGECDDPQIKGWEYILATSGKYTKHQFDILKYLLRNSELHGDSVQGIAFSINREKAVAFIKETEYGKEFISIEINHLKLGWEIYFAFLRYIREFNSPLIEESIRKERLDNLRKYVLYPNPKLSGRGGYPSPYTGKFEHEKDRREIYAETNQVLPGNEKDYWIWIGK